MHDNSLSSPAAAPESGPAEGPGPTACDCMGSEGWLAESQLAEEDKILATPTLAKILPPPVRRIIGDLSDRERVLIGLDLLYDELTEEDLVDGEDLGEGEAP